MKSIEFIHQEKEVNFGAFTNDFLQNNEMANLFGGQEDSFFCRTKKTCDEFTGSCNRIVCGVWDQEQTAE